MLVIQPLTPDLRDTGKRVICTDCTGAGAGEIVYFTRGKEASFPFLPKEVPTDMTVVGIVDSIHVGCAGTPAGAVPLHETTAQAGMPKPAPPRTSRSKAPKC
jgi:microcompartment protein CcmK/EutM